MEGTETQETVQMSASKALVELKLLDKRINKALTEGIFVTAHRGNESTTIHGMSRDEADKRIKASIQSVRDLIENRGAIKRALVMSNAATQVKVADKSYTVAEAIERKNSIQYETNLLETLKAHLAKVLETIEAHNAQVDKDMNNLISKNAEVSEQDKEHLEQTIKTFRELNELNLHDPLKIRSAIDDLTADIDSFTADVDVALSESNALTSISV